MSLGGKTKCCGCDSYGGYEGRRRVHAYCCNNKECRHEWCDLCGAPAIIDVNGIKPAPCPKCGHEDTSWKGNYSGAYPNYQTK